jgi:hypothetical protein
MSNIYKDPSIGGSYQVSVHLVKKFLQRRSLEINLWLPRMLTDRDEL